MENFKVLFLTVMFLCIFSNTISKIVLPNKLRYLENMLNSEVVAKAAKIRQRLDANPNMAESEKNWPSILAKYGEEKAVRPYNNFYNKRRYFK